MSDSVGPAIWIPLVWGASAATLLSPASTRNADPPSLGGHCETAGDSGFCGSSSRSSSCSGLIGRTRGVRFATAWRLSSSAIETVIP